MSTEKNEHLEYKETQLNIVSRSLFLAGLVESFDDDDIPIETLQYVRELLEKAEDALDDR